MYWSVAYGVYHIYRACQPLYQQCIHTLDVASYGYLLQYHDTMVQMMYLRSPDTSYLMYYTYSGYLPTVRIVSTGGMVLWYTMVYPLWGLHAPCIYCICSGVPLTRYGILCIPIPDTIFYGLMSRSEVLRYLISGDLIPILSTYTGCGLRWYIYWSVAYCVYHVCRAYQPLYQQCIYSVCSGVPHTRYGILWIPTPIP